MGTGMGFGRAKGRREPGSNRELAERMRAAVVKGHRECNSKSKLKGSVGMWRRGGATRVKVDKVLEGWMKVARAFKGEGIAHPMRKRMVFQVMLTTCNLSLNAT